MSEILPELIEFTPRGLYCPAAKTYIDPWRPVERAVITHAHSDHARFGSKHYLAHHLTVPVLRHRLGREITTQGIEYGNPINLSGVTLSLHPAGHIPGSAQVRLEYKGHVLVISGDYKTEDDGLSTPFEVVPCDTFITESTFGLPIFQWQKQTTIRDELISWWRTNQRENLASVVFAYSLGKAQRLLHLVGDYGEVISHGAVHGVTEALRANGLRMPPAARPTTERTRDSYRHSLIIAPPSALNTPWLKRFMPYATGCASGWMAIRGIKRRRGIDKGFVISDHADFSGLVSTIQETGASRVFVTHGYTAIFARYLNELGIEAQEVKTEFKNNELADEIQDPQPPHPDSTMEAKEAP